MLDPNELLSDVQFVAFDLETTGLSAHSCQIVEFGAIRFHIDAGILDCFEQLVDPECPIPWRVTQIHGITDAMVRDMPTVRQTLSRFIDFLEQEPAVLMAHNAAFDLSFLNAAIRSHGAARINNPVIDTVQLARKAIPGLYNYRLETLAIGFELAQTEDHRALSDSRLVMGLFQKIIAASRSLTNLQRLFSLAPPLHGQAAARRARQTSVHHQHLTLAIQQQRTVVMVYDGGTKGLSDRRVTPRSLVNSRGTRCLIAFCHADRIEKTFRLDRIRDLRIDEG